MKKLLKQPVKLSNWDMASDLEKTKNAQEFNAYKLQQLELIKNPTKENLAQIETIKAQIRIVKAAIMKLKKG